MARNQGGGKPYRYELERWGATRAEASPAHTLSGFVRAFVAGYGRGTQPLAPALVSWHTRNI
jgi:hypothetical protein